MSPAKSNRTILVGVNSAMQTIPIVSTIGAGRLDLSRSKNFQNRKTFTASIQILLFNRRPFQKGQAGLTGSNTTKRRRDAKVLAGFCSHDGSDPGWKFDAVRARGM